MNTISKFSIAAIATAAVVLGTGKTVQAANLVVNGDFSAGNSGFSSNYKYGSLMSEGTYVVGTNPRDFHPLRTSFGDHTTETGNMMIVNGDFSVNSTVWSQTINVEPNTEYDFATWIASWGSMNPAQLEFTINSTLIGPLFTASATNGLWEEFSATWNSGSNTSATISIVNQNTARDGNGFTLDDISFEAVAEPTDPTSVPESSSVLGLVAFGAFGAGSLLKRKLQKKASRRE